MWQLVTPAYWNPIAWDDADVNCPEKIMSLVDQAYVPVGGYIGRDLLLIETDVWMIYNVCDPEAIIFGKVTPFGNKWTCIASEPTNRARRVLLHRMIELLSQKGNYAEVSGPIASHLGHPIDATTGIVARVLGKAIIREPSMGPCEYSRMIHGQQVRKVMVGRPRLEQQA